MNVTGIFSKLPKSNIFSLKLSWTILNKSLFFERKVPGPPRSYCVLSNIRRQTRVQQYRYFSQILDAKQLQYAKRARQIPRLKPAVRDTSTGKWLLLLATVFAGVGVQYCYLWMEDNEEYKKTEKKLALEPIILPKNLDDLRNEEMNYTKVKAKGIFDHSRELFIGPRANIHRPRSENNSGLYVVTPFKLSDRDETILVNRGFVDFLHQPHQLRKKGQIEGEVEITGIVRHAEPGFYFSFFDNKETTGYFEKRVVEEMSDIAQTYPLLIDADQASSVQGGPVGGQTKVDIDSGAWLYAGFSFGAAVLCLRLRSSASRAVSPHVMEYLKKNHSHKLRDPSQT